MGRSAIIGSHLYFIPEGKTVDTQTVSSSVKPDHDPESNWTDYKLGTITEAEAATDIQSVVVRAPIEDVGGGVPGGVYQDTDEFATQANLEWNVTMAQLNFTAFQAIWLSGEITGSGTVSFTPLSQSGMLKGWAWLRQYDHNNLLVMQAEFWCKLQLAGAVPFNEDVVRVPLNLKALSNALNTGALYSFA